MEGRCAVETLAELSFSQVSCAPKLKSCFGTDVFISTGSDEVYVFSFQDRQITAVLQFTGPVSDLVVSPEKQLIYVACSSGIYSVHLSLLHSRVQSAAADASSGPVYLKISAECLFVEEQGSSTLLLVSSVLLSLSQRDSSWLLTVYETSEQSASSTCEMLRSFRLPLVTDVVNDSTGRRTGRRPVLICVHSGDATQPPSSFTSLSEGSLADGHFYLEPALFKVLFGIDTALVKSPIILFGLPDGRLCHIPLRLPGSQLQALHSLEQPVVFVGTSVVMETGPGHSQFLVAVGEQGRVLLIKTDKGGPVGGNKSAEFTEGCVQGPVVCAWVEKHRLYYSTGSDLLALDLVEGSHVRAEQARDEQASRKTAVALQSTTSLNVCRVIALAALPCNTAGEAQLLALSCRGQLQTITLPVGGEAAGLSKLSSRQGGCSIRDLLSAIGDVCERTTVLKTAIKSKNQTLRHLNQVLNISFLLIQNSEEQLSIQEKPIRCHATTSWNRLLQRDSLDLKCVLVNGSSYVLERGWTLNITVFPLCYFPRGGSRSTNFSFPFHDLHPGETLEISLPLAAAGNASFPITVSCSLIFSLSSLLGEEELAHLPGPQSISLPLNTLTVDWLHVLQVKSSADKNVTSHSHDTTDAIQAFLNSRWSRCSGRAVQGGESASNPEREQYSASFKVLSDLLRDALLPNTSDVEFQGPKTVPSNVCICLLGWLLSEGPGGVKMGHRGNKIVLDSSVVHARALNGHMIRITAKEVSLEEESQAAVEVQVESSSMAAVCGLHHAILLRIQALLQRAPEQPVSTRTMQSLCLRQALQRAEQMLQRIQRSQSSGAFGGGVSTGQMMRSLLSVYRELRQNPLLII